MQETNQNKDKNSARKFEIAIIGSGFAGICMGIKLREAGITDFVILEKADEIGGTWRDNTYPGAACDVSSHLYSFSFELNPKWKRMFSGQQEIFEYLKHCIKKYDLLKHIRFNAAVMGGKYEEESGIWLVDIADQSPVECRFWINGMGPLNRAVTPDIPGKESFKGAAFHSSSWNHDVDLKDKKVAVIGTGASAIQIVPAIAPMAKQLHLFQRTPAWIMPKHDREMLLLEQILFRKMPFIQRLYRNVIYGINELTAIAMVYKPRLIKFLEKFAIRNMRKQVKDPELRKKLEPKYSFGCKRVLLSNDYYPALTRDNVEVITDSIASIYENGLKTDKNEA
ncbi:MAG: NAD(P)/FAD-dependent oxidoreductase, partial [Chitinophagales bacterium]